MNIINNITLAIRPDGTYTPFSNDAWGYAGQMTLLGLVMVFAVLATLWLVLTVFKVIFAEKTSKTNKKTESVSEIDTVPSVNTEVRDDSELIAVITAAVAAYMSQEKGESVDTSGFRVVSFRRTKTAGRSWNEK